MIQRLVRRQWVPAPLDRVWPFFATPRNLPVLTPPELQLEILWGDEEPMVAGQLIAYRVRPFPGWRAFWLTEIAHLEEGRFFVDEQRLGPYRFWYHEHLFQEEAGGVTIVDRVTYQLPFGVLGSWAHTLWVRRQLEGIFTFRERKIRELFGG